MSHPPVHKIIPSLVMAVATAIPIATSVEILAHVSSTPAAPQQSAAAAPVPTAQSAAPAPAPTQSSTTPATAAPAAPAAAPRTYTGPSVDNGYGLVQATITVTGHKITNVTISAPQDYSRSAYINAQAVPILQSETLQAQSAQINLVSGATYTSDAYVQSLQGALSQAQL